MNAVQMLSLQVVLVVVVFGVVGIVTVAGVRNCFCYLVGLVVQVLYNREL
jgi:hypothetical protein